MEDTEKLYAKRISPKELDLLIDLGIRRQLTGCSGNTKGTEMGCCSRGILQMSMPEYFLMPNKQI